MITSTSTYSDGPVAQELAVHGFDGGVRGLERGEREEREAARVAGARVAHDLRRLEEHAERRERVVQELLVDVDVQVADEQVRADVQLLRARRRFRQPQRLPEQLHHIEDFACVFRVLLIHHLDERVPAAAATATNSDSVRELANTARIESRVKRVRGRHSTTPNVIAINVWENIAFLYALKSHPNQKSSILRQHQVSIETLERHLCNKHSG